MGLYKGQSQYKFDGYVSGEPTHARISDVSSRELRREAERLARKKVKKHQSVQNGFLN
mgnify:CR=1 FL=1|tara:strand:+ start:2123 stop:2296 length:174 start_codon:yes stop_codon:yes gene_type:complete